MYYRRQRLWGCYRDERGWLTSEAVSSPSRVSRSTPVMRPMRWSCSPSSGCSPNTKYFLSILLLRLVMSTLQHSVSWVHTSTLPHGTVSRTTEEYLHPWRVPWVQSNLYFSTWYYEYNNTKISISTCMYPVTWRVPWVLVSTLKHDEYLQLFYDMEGTISI